MSPLSNPAPTAGTTIEPGELNLTANSLLHTDSAGAAEAIADVAAGQCFISQGVSSKPAYSASPAFTGLTLSGLTPGSVPFAGAGGLINQDNANIFWDDATKRLGIGTSSPQAKLEVGGNPGASVGGFPSGNLHVTGQSASVNANAVITGHNLFGGNKQLWYLGSSSGSNDAITFINRQNASLSLATNSTTRMTILAASNTLQGNAGMTLQGGSGVHTLTLSGGASAASSISIGIGSELIGFFGGSPAVRPTGVGVTTAQIHAALVSLGLITV